MFVARILYPVRVLGPGERIGIWFAGCEHHCNGCSNPELWNQDAKYKTKLETVMKLIRDVSELYPVDGFTLTGGDPFFQPEALNKLLPELGKISDDILVYTGYEYEDILEKYPGLLHEIAVLIDGKYIAERNKGDMLRGSDNQRILFLKSSFQNVYHSYLEENKNEIQNFQTRDAVISVGIHHPDFEEQLSLLTEKKGLKADE